MTGSLKLLAPWLLPIELPQPPTHKKKKLLEALDVVEIFGKRKSAIRLMPSPDTKNNYIKVDGITRQNINMSLNDFVTIKKINAEKTKKIVLSPTNSQSLLFNDDSKILLNKIDGQVVTSGDSIAATMPGGKVESFKVMALAPSGSSIINSKTKVEIKRDFQNLISMWEDIKNKTIKSNAPNLIHDEGSIIKRAVRDMYNSDVEEILVQGEPAFKTCKSYMKSLMPSHTKKIQQYTDDQILLFQKFGID